METSENAKSGTGEGLAYLFAAVPSLGDTLRGRIDHHGREMLCYGIDREDYA